MALRRPGLTLEGGEASSREGGEGSFCAGGEGFLL
jgi:hypothetical protein